MSYWEEVDKKNGARVIKKKTSVGRLEITFEHKSKKCMLGRFGGGWNWELGFVAGGHTVIVNLLVCYIRFDWRYDLKKIIGHLQIRKTKIRGFDGYVVETLSGERVAPSEKERIFADLKSAITLARDEAKKRKRS